MGVAALLWLNVLLPEFLDFMHLGATFCDAKGSLTVRKAFTDRDRTLFWYHRKGHNHRPLPLKIGLDVFFVFQVHKEVPLLTSKLSESGSTSLFLPMFVWKNTTSN